MATKVKEAPHRNILRLAERLTHLELAPAEAPSVAGAGSSPPEGKPAKSPCCS
jgi:hypothetical protein